MSREAFESRYEKSRLRRWAFGIYPDDYSDPQVNIDWLIWQAAQADAFERAAKMLHHMSTEQSGKGYSRRTCSTRNQRAAECRDAIRTLAKEAT